MGLPFPVQNVMWNGVAAGVEWGWGWRGKGILPFEVPSPYTNGRLKTPALAAWAEFRGSSPGKAASKTVWPATGRDSGPLQRQRWPA